jgi:hypothetical protein
MSGAASPSVVRPLGVLFDVGSVAGLSDGQLLERFRRLGSEPGMIYPVGLSNTSPVGIGNGLASSSTLSFAS